LGHGFSLSVIAEGVEYAEQRECLASMGCDAFQGYLFGMPLTAEQLSF
jgi:EAL domain-containing protein (putative c-di-GMP-specific phosphodiesterase class I)